MQGASFRLRALSSILNEQVKIKMCFHTHSLYFRVTIAFGRINIKLELILLSKLQQFSFIFFLVFFYPKPYLFKVFYSSKKTQLSCALLHTHTHLGLACPVQPLLVTEAAGG